MAKDRASQPLRTRLRAITSRFRVKTKNSENLSLHGISEQQKNIYQGDKKSMSVLNRSDLEQSPLADLHAIAREVQVEGYRRLRKDELIEAILERPSGEIDLEGLAPTKSSQETSSPTRKTSKPSEDRTTGSTKRPSRQNRSRQENSQKSRPVKNAATQESKKEYAVAGVIEARASGSALVLVKGDEVDAYLSKDEVKNFGLVDGDQIEGRARPPRRGERYATLTGVKTVNGKSERKGDAALNVDELKTTLPTKPLKFLEEDKVLADVLKVAPVGFGSRVAVVGPAYAGKTRFLQQVAKLAFEQKETDLEVIVALSGVRPEEVESWQTLCEPASIVTLGAPTSTQARAVKAVVDRAKRSAVEGKNVVLLIDSLCHFDAVHVRTILSAARNLVDHGSLTIFAVLNNAQGGETTTIAFDFLVGAAKRVPTIDVANSGTLAPQLLVNKTRANTIARAYRKLLEVGRQDQLDETP